MNGGFTLSPVDQSAITADNFFSFLFWIKKKTDNTLFSVLFVFIFLPCWCCLSSAAITREPSWKKTKHCFFTWSFKTRCLTSERLSSHPHKIPLCNLTNRKILPWLNQTSCIKYVALIFQPLGLFFQCPVRKLCSPLWSRNVMSTVIIQYCNYMLV